MNVAKEQEVREMKFGVHKKTVDEWYDKVKDASLPDSPTVNDIREKINSLARLMQILMYEKTISVLAHGRLQVSLWNNLIDAVKTSISAVETIHQSLCNENKVIKYQT